MRKPKPSASAVYRYKRSHYDSIQFYVPAGKKNELSEYAKNSGAKSLSAWITSLIEKETGVPLVLTGELPTLKNKKEEKEEGPV